MRDEALVRAMTREHLAAVTATREAITQLLAAARSEMADGHSPRPETAAAIQRASDALGEVVRAIGNAQNIEKARTQH